jgi:acyl dehydratase
MVEPAILMVGDTVISAPMRLTRDAAIGFAQEFDPQSMHLDDAAGEASFFGTLVASGWHVLALTMRLAVETHPFGDQPLIGAEISQIRFTKPVLPGTDLVVSITFEAVEEGKGQHGYNILRVLTLDADTSEVLVRQRWRMLRT